MDFTTSGIEENVSAIPPAKLLKEFNTSPAFPVIFARNPVKLLIQSEPTFNATTNPSIIIPAINGVVEIINKMINSVNRLSIDIPNPFGDDKHIGFNIPNIPQLANGGYVEAGHGGVLAQIGEGRYDEVTKNTKQIKEEEDTIIRGVERLLENRFGNNNTTNTNNSQIPLVIQLGDIEIATLLIDILKREVKRTGRPILGGV